MALALQAELRNTKTKGQLRQLRAKGKIPGIVYGNGSGSIPITVDEKELFPIVTYHADSIIALDIPGQGTKQVQIGGVQKDCIVGVCEHIDFRLVEAESSSAKGA